MITASVVRAVELWISVFPFTVAGILGASIAVELRIFDLLFPLLKPILHRAHFTPHSGVALMAAFGSPITAVAMISEFYGEGKIDQRETLLATVATWFPQTIFESFVYIFPTIIPILGIVGLAYLSLFILNGIIVALLVVIAGRVLLAQKDCEFASENERKNIVLRTALKRGLLNSVNLLKRVVLFAFPVSVLVFVLIDLGLFDTVSGHLDWMPLPSEALAIVPLVVANPTAAYITVSNLLETEVLDFKLALLTLLVGNLLVSARYILTHRLPYYSGIFGPVLSLKIISVSAGLRLGLTVLMIFALLLML